MPATKTLEQRQAELRALLATLEGREKLEALATRYYAVSGRIRVEGTSLVTYIQVHERERGLFAG
jgi:hypothetical protein